MNASVAKGTIVGWKIYYNSTSGNENETGIMAFRIREFIPPTWSNLGSTPENNTAVNTATELNISALWTDNIQIDKCWNSSRINTSGDWINATASGIGAGNWINYTYYFSNEQGSNITMKIYCNDTSNNVNVTDVWYWWNVTAPTDTCDYTSGDFVIDCSENCVVDTNADLGGNTLRFINSGTVYINADITNVGSIEPARNCIVTWAREKELN